MNLFMAMDFMFEPFKELVKEKYGEEFAKQVYSSKSEYMIDNTTILSDEDLKKSGLYEKYNNQSIFQIYSNLLYIPGNHSSHEHVHIPLYLFDDFVKLTKIEAL